MMPVKKESTLQIQCVEYMTILAQKHNDLVFFSIPNEGIMFSLRAFKIPENTIAAIVNHFKKMGMLSGIFDFQILYKSKFLFMEFKSEIGVLSNNQKIIFKKIEQSGFKIYIIKTFENFKQLLFEEFDL